jgi:hypothetical protein
MEAFSRFSTIGTSTKFKRLEFRSETGLVTEAVAVNIQGYVAQLVRAQHS